MSEFFNENISKPARVSRANIAVMLDERSDIEVTAVIPDLGRRVVISGSGTAQRREAARVTG